MKTIKFISPFWKYKFLTEGSIRIGSFDYYKNIENQNIKDEFDGGASIVYKGKKPITEEHNALFFNDRIQLTNGWSIDTNGCPIIGKPSTYNTFIFCCSHFENYSEIELSQKSLGKEDYYEIFDTKKFVDIISNALLKFCYHHFLQRPYLIDYKKLDLKKHLKISCVAQKVVYKDEPKYNIVTEKELDNFNPKTVNIDELFTKDIRYKENSEYRFIWVLFLDDKENNYISMISIPFEYLDFKELELSKTISC